MAQSSNKQPQPKSEIHQEIRTFSADVIYRRTFTPVNNSNYQTLKKSINNSNYKKYEKAINNSNYKQNNYGKR